MENIKYRAKKDNNFIFWSPKEDKEISKKYGKSFWELYNDGELENLGMYTGRDDKNGVEIFEDDIFELEDCYCGVGFYRGIVEFDKHNLNFCIDRTLSGKYVGGHCLQYLHDKGFVVGNKFDNKL